MRSTAFPSAMKNSKKSAKPNRTLGILLAGSVITGLIAFIVKFGQGPLLRLYISSGIGDCRAIPLLCMTPRAKIENPPLDAGYSAKLLPYEFQRIIVSLPEGVVAVQEKIKKVYYYRAVKRPQENTVAYLLRQDPDFFVSLFPRLDRQCIINDYEFIRRTMFARLDAVQNLTDAFFVIMKGIFIPDLGDQARVTMAEFNLGDKKGFINYNISPAGNYFDCNVIDNERNFFKVYIRDRSAGLTLDNVLTIISTVKAAHK